MLLDEGQGCVGDLPPAAVDGQGVPPAGNLHISVTPGLRFCPLKAALAFPSRNPGPLHDSDLGSAGQVALRPVTWRHILLSLDARPD